MNSTSLFTPLNNHTILQIAQIYGSDVKKFKIEVMSVQQKGVHDFGLSCTRGLSAK